MKITRLRLVLAGLAALIACCYVITVLVSRPSDPKVPQVPRSYPFPPNYSLIEEKLYMGGLVESPPPDSVAVLNVSEERDVFECEIHVWKPIREAAPAPSIAWLREQVAFIEAQQQAGRTTYVHCAAGMNRSGMVVIAYVMRKHDWPRDKALEFVRSKRPQVWPNRAFMALLNEWEKVMNKP